VNRSADPIHLERTLQTDPLNSVDANGQVATGALDISAQNCLDLTSDACSVGEELNNPNSEEHIEEAAAESAYNAQVAAAQAEQGTAQAQQQMTTSAAGVAFIKGWEGWNGTVDKKTGLTFAKDGGFRNGTIGWGHQARCCQTVSVRQAAVGRRANICAQLHSFRAQPVGQSEVGIGVAISCQQLAAGPDTG
jgi:hypothetical protein